MATARKSKLKISRKISVRMPLSPQHGHQNVPQIVPQMVPQMACRYRDHQHSGHGHQQHWQGKAKQCYLSMEQYWLETGESKSSDVEMSAIVIKRLQTSLAISLLTCTAAIADLPSNLSPLWENIMTVWLYGCSVLSSV